ncbi:MAG: hypothetical protein N2255_03040 [Kiritimatiellae bacterium]|nr:hypothetical protein [Kiritimatiellia bacterium]
MSRRQGRGGNEPSEGSWRQDPRGHEQERHEKAQLRGESAQHDEALLTRGRVNAGFARGQLTHLIWGDLPGIGWGRTLA